MNQIGSVLCKSPFFVRSRPNNLSDLRPIQGGSTHGTRLKAYIQGTIGQVFGLEMGTTCGDGQHLGMGSGIVQQFHLIVGFGDDFVVANQYGPNRNFSAFSASARAFFKKYSSE
jgi:hypothetical protein